MRPTPAKEPVDLVRDFRSSVLFLQRCDLLEEPRKEQWQEAKGESVCELKREDAPRQGECLHTHGSWVLRRKFRCA